MKNPTAEAILDSSAILAYIFEEPGGEVVAKILDRSVMSSVNIAEVIGKLIDRGLAPQEAVATLDRLSMDVEPVSADLGLAAGLLHARTRGRGVSLGDRFCLALAQQMNLPVYTADRAWTELGLDIDIRLIR